MWHDARVGAKELLDRVQAPAAIAELEAEPGSHAAAVAAELGPATTLAELATRDAQLIEALQRIDEAIARVMKIRLEHSLASESLPPVTRKMFAHTVTSYSDDLGLLEQRVRAVAARSANPDAIVTAVVDAARATLALRAALRDGVLAHVRALAVAAIADADRYARDRTLPDAERLRWSAARRDQEVLAAEPDRIEAAPFAARIASWPEQLDEPAPAPEVHPADLIELE